MANTPNSANPNTLDSSTTINHLLRASTTQVVQDDGSKGTVTLRDYQHAKKIFVDGNYRLSPKYGFLYYVEFDLNPMITNVSNTAAQELGMIVKAVNLPKFSLEVKAHNAYNRVNLVQNKIKYDPISITFHDDQADNVRSFWYDYYSFYYRDSDFNSATYQVISKYQERPSFEWGYTPRPTASYNAGNAYQNYQYIQAIRIYSLYQKSFSECELINPIITSFRHGDHNVSDGTGLLEHQMTVQFETVKYYTGYTTQNTVGGYIDLHYDNTPSPLNPVGGPEIVGDGKGGFTNTNGTVTDLANFNLTTAGGAVVPTPNSGLANSLLGSLGLGNSSTLGAAALTPSPNGYAIPSLGSLRGTGITTKVLGQAIKSSAINAATNAISSAATGFVNGLFSSLTKSGTGTGSATGGSNAPGGSQTNQNAATTVSGLATQLQQGVNQQAATALTALKNNVAQEVKNVQAQVSSLTSSLSGGGDAGGILGSLSGGASSLASGLSSTVSGATASLGGALSGATASLTSAASGVTSSIGGALNSAQASLSGAIGGSTDSLTSAASNLASGASGALNNATQAVQAAASTVTAGGDSNSNPTA
jgi:hypothetical protein